MRDLLAHAVSGIHGVPYDIWPKKAWNKKLEDMKAPNDEPTGFCTHSSILFLTWHRPYLALFEVCESRQPIGRMKSDFEIGQST